MTQFKYNRVLLALILLGLLAALAVSWQRHVVEENSTRVELAMDYEDIVELAQIEGVAVRDLMQMFKEAGISSLCVYETTLDKLHKSGKVTAVPGSQIIHEFRTGTLSDSEWRRLIDLGRIKAEDVYVIGQNRQVFDEVKSDLIRRLGPERVSVVSMDNRPILAVKANYEKLLKWNLGLSTEEMREVERQGFFVIARPTNYSKVRPEDVDSVFARMEGIDNISAVMFVGEEALGYPDLLSLTAERLKARNITLAMIEHPLQLQFVKQEGLIPLASMVDYQAARVYVIPKDEQLKLKPDEAIHRWILTDQERNIRINLLRPFLKPEVGKTLIETNLNYVASVKKGLAEKGFSFGRAGTYPPYFPGRLLLALMIAGATAAGVLYLTLVRPFAPKYQYILLIGLTAVLAFPVLKGGGNIVRQAAALVSATVFPVLAVTWQLDRWRGQAPRNSSLGRILSDGVVSLTITIFLSLIGGFYVAALLGDVRYLLEIEIYRGVKLTFIAPLILITLIYLTRYSLFGGENAEDARGIWRQFIKILDYPVYIKTLGIFALGAIAAWFFIGRSGHTAGVPVFSLELKIRAFFENAMYARPRSKEFAIGHPAFMLAVYALYRNWPRLLHFGLVIFATIAQGSLVETFAHLRTPVFMSFVRGLDGLIVGAVIGAIAVAGLEAFRCLSAALGRRTAAHE